MRSLDHIEILRAIDQPNFCPLREKVSDDGTTWFFAAQLSHCFKQLARYGYAEVMRRGSRLGIRLEAFR